MWIRLPDLVRYLAHMVVMWLFGVLYFVVRQGVWRMAEAHLVPSWLPSNVDVVDLVPAVIVGEIALHWRAPRWARLV